MAKFPGAESFVPNTKALPVLRNALQSCKGCDLYLHATQGVFGAGPVRARMILVGEQPGNDEDKQGTPFVGPAGKILETALNEAEIDRGQTFVTNAVKHFKFEERGKRRIHKKPTISEVKACRPWLDAEIELVHPEVIVCLGATAAQAMLGSQFRLTVEGSDPRPFPPDMQIIATLHPSAVLRAATPEQRDEYYKKLISDLRRARLLLS